MNSAQKTRVPDPHNTWQLHNSDWARLVFLLPFAKHPRSISFDLRNSFKKAAENDSRRRSTSG